jgi:hypothetical protein
MLACGYVVRDANGLALVWIYSRDSEAEAMQAKVADQGRGAPDRHQRGAAAGVAGKGRSRSNRIPGASTAEAKYWMIEGVM